MTRGFFGGALQQGLDVKQMEQGSSQWYVVRENSRFGPDIRSMLLFLQWSMESVEGHCLTPSSEIFKIWMYKALKDVVGSHCWPYFDKKFAIETSWGQRKLCLNSDAFPSVKKTVDKLIVCIHPIACFWLSPIAWNAFRAYMVTEWMQRSNLPKAI